MMIVVPARTEKRLVLRTDLLTEAFEAIGTPAYPQACFRVLEDVFDADHWALFRYDSDDSVRCMATASRAYADAAQRNISSFVIRCHKFDPALLAFRRRHRDGPCLAKISIGDIDDPQYRHCFELTHVRERLSFISELGPNVIQLSVFRASPTRTFSPAEMRCMTALAKLIIATTRKHESLVEPSGMLPPHLNMDAIELRLARLGARLSKREREVCARAVLGRTIQQTAAELGVERTSVVTYRQRAYEKLGIARQTDLLALVYGVEGGRLQ